ncbi:MAG: long-chain-fatty-acid--CoA ligase [Caulobacterales bacterium]|jgi:acyl-CoA synthetase (AMP-forming)/AMP-acid ligase II
MIDLAGVGVLADITRRQAEKRPHEIAVKLGPSEITFAELDARASRVADRLLAMGLVPGDRAAFLSKNTDVFPELMFGAAKARVCLTPVNARLAAPEIAYVIQDSAAKVFFAGPEFLALADKSLEACANQPLRIALLGEASGWTPYAAWRDAGAAIDPMLPNEGQDDVLQLYTSGTTGMPKGVQLTNANYLAFMSLAQSIPGFDFQPGETVLCAMPQFHVAGTNISMLGVASGARTVMLPDLIPAVVLDLMQQERVNHAFLVPAVILMLMSQPNIAQVDFSALKSISYGASPIAEDLLATARARFGCDMLQLYGMTETCGAATYLPPAAHDPVLGKLRSCGVAWPGIDVKLVDANGQEVPLGQVGEIVIRAPVNMKGYWNKPEATAETIRNSWLHTGDAAYQDSDGYFFIYDRVKDMIVSGGENVYPAEVENAIFGHPQVADVAVIGVPDEKWGEAVKAIVVAKPGQTVDAESVIAWARERIAAYKAPKSVDVVETIPRNPSGKILRRELRAPYWEGKTRMVS